MIATTNSTFVTSARPETRILHNRILAGMVFLVGIVGVVLLNPLMLNGEEMVMVMVKNGSQVQNDALFLEETSVESTADVGSVDWEEAQAKVQEAVAEKERKQKALGFWEQAKFYALTQKKKVETFLVRMPKNKQGEERAEAEEEVEFWGKILEKRMKDVAQAKKEIRECDLNIISAEMAAEIAKL